MTRRLFGPVAAFLLVAVSLGAHEQTSAAADLAAAIDRLGSLDAYEVRMEAARTIRRAPATRAVPALSAAARQHRDEYVRFRALVLLTGFAQPSTQGLMRDLLTDPNDRIRTVVSAWFEHHPDPAALGHLLDALRDERSEFVRPALTRAVAAHGEDPSAQAALVPLVGRGEDYFRGAVIEALGDYRGTYALREIEAVARLDGPLQDDAITAVGKLGDGGQLALLAELQREVPRPLQPTVSASLCLLGVNCDAHKAFIRDSLAFALAAEVQQPVLRGAVHALAVLSLGGHDDALAALFAAGATADPAAEAPISLGAGLVALRDPHLVLRVLAASPDRDASILLLRDAFDMLNEDFEEERFFVVVRAAYWAAPVGTPARDVAESLIRVLEF